MESLLRDIRFGVRILLRSPGITAAVIFTLALGIGANSAMFSVVDGLLLHPVRYSDPATLAFIWERDPQGIVRSASSGDFLDLRAAAKSFSDVAAWLPGSFILTGESRPRQEAGASVTANFFQTLGVKPLLGRTFLPDEDGLDHTGAAAHVVVVSYRLWQESLSADPNVLGRTLSLSSMPYTIVGVMPPNFNFWWRQHQLWVPLSISERDRAYHYLITLGRLNASRERASAEMTVLARSLEQSYPRTNKGWTIQVDDMQEWFVTGMLRTRLLLLFGALGMVLLIACTNVASLLLARSAARTREIAVRIALGATRWRLTRQLLTESMLLSSIGGALGLALAWTLIRALPKVVPANVVPPDASIELSGLVICFTLGLAVLTGVLFGLAPAWAAARPKVQEALKDASRGSTAGRSRQRFRQVMVSAEVAVAMVLLASAGLMMQSLRKLAEVDLGCDPRNVLILRMFLSQSKYDAAHALQLHRLALQRISALPGVKSVTVASNLPLLTIRMEVPFDVESSAASDVGDRPAVAYTTVSADYFRTLGIPVKRGRTFMVSDSETAPAVAIVNEALAARYFPKGDAIGKRILLNRPMLGKNGFGETVHPEIVGVVGNVKLADLTANAEPLIYAPYAQNVWDPGAWFAVRTEVDPAGLTAAIRNEMAGLDKEQPIDQVGALGLKLANHYAQPRFQTELMGAFASLALLLAVVGIYGVNAYAVVQRRHEIGVRMALGASPGMILREILGQGIRLTAIGIGVGLAGAMAIGSLLKSLLVGVSATDPLTLLAVAALLALVSIAACYFPARRATRIDPAVSLRPE